MRASPLQEVIIETVTNLLMIDRRYAVKIMFTFDYLWGFDFFLSKNGTLKRRKSFCVITAFQHLTSYKTHQQPIINKTSLQHLQTKEFESIYFKIDCRYPEEISMLCEVTYDCGHQKNLSFKEYYYTALNLQIKHIDA